MTAELVPLGVHLDLEMHRYLADPGLSGSAFHKLEANPPDWFWDRPENGLKDLMVPEEDSKARILGTICHKVLLEGIDAYEAEYCVKPNILDHDDALDTIDDFKDYCATNGLPVSAKRKADYIERILAHNPKAKIWDAYCQGVINGRIPIGFSFDAQARLLDRFVRADPNYSKLLSGGLSEVSIFWEEEGIRYKSRLDYLRPTAVVDVKTFGRPPRRGLMRSFLSDRVSHGDDKQAVHNWRAAKQIPTLLKQGEITASGPNASQRLQLLEQIAPHEKVFVWLGLRVGGAPCGLGVRFDVGSLPWNWAEQKIAYAVEQFKAYREKFGDELWIRSEGILTPDISDFPFFASEVPV